MKFDMTNIHTIFEAAAEEKVDTKAAHDETGANLDNTLGDNDLLSIFDDICPITGDVFAAMKNAAKDPKNLKITMTKNGDGENPKLFVEAVEFMTFCEAGDYNIGEAAEEIIDTYKEEIPAMNNAEFHVVFPSDALNKNVLGSENFGKAVEDDWASRLMRGCLRYGIKVNSGVEEAPVDEAAVNEAASSGGFLRITVNGKKRSIDFRDKYKDSKNKAEIQDEVVKQVEAACNNEETIIKKIYKDYLAENNDADIKADADKNAGYLDHFQVYEGKSGYVIDAYLNKHQLYITHIKGGKVTASSKVMYND